MDIASRDQILSEAFKGKVAQVGSVHPLGAGMLPILPSLSREELKQKGDEYVRLISSADSNLISVLEDLRDRPGSNFNFIIGSLGTVVTNVPIQRKGSLDKDAHLKGDGRGEDGQQYLMIKLSFAEVHPEYGILDNGDRTPDPVSYKLSPPHMLVAVPGQSEDRIGLITRGIYFENEDQADNAIAHVVATVVNHAGLAQKPAATGIKAPKP